MKRIKKLTGEKVRRAMHDEIAKLKAANARLREENEILKALDESHKRQMDELRQSMRGR